MNKYIDTKMYGFKNLEWKTPIFFNKKTLNFPNKKQNLSNKKLNIPNKKRNFLNKKTEFRQFWSWKKEALQQVISDFYPFFVWVDLLPQFAGFLRHLREWDARVVFLDRGSHAVEPEEVWS